MNEVCRCYPPPYTTDSPEICEAIGGVCSPLELEYDAQMPPSSQVYPNPSPLGESGSCAKCGGETHVQKVMHVPFGFDACSVETLEDPDRRPYIWEW